MKNVVRFLTRPSLIVINAVITLTALELTTPQSSNAFVIFGNDGLSGGFRWDADARTINGNERSLNGGLRYSLQGGSYEAYRDLFTWDVLPTVVDFQKSIEDAFAAWTVIDPATGLGTNLSFIADLNTPVVGTGFGGVNTNGAEIDLLAAVDAFSWNAGDSSTRGEAFFRAVFDDVTLTSGTTGYSNGGAISGADLTLNNNPGAVYSLDLFRRLMTHEIGHTIGLGDVEGDINPNAFIDDNADAGDALATLTNPIAQLVDPYNPANSPFFIFNIPDDDPGTRTPGVDILMESRGLGIASGNPVTNLTPLSNDDYGGRQFLYPYVQPIPTPALLPGLIGFAIAAVRKRKAEKAQCNSNTL
jgi:hypothetical protein